MRGVVGLLIVGLVAMFFVIMQPPVAPPTEAARLPLPEKPWLSRAVRDQIVGGPNALGPLFDGITLGGVRPPDEVRAQIAAFAKQHDVTIDFEIVDEILVAIRFDVTYGGCCGYEGADGLARGLGQPHDSGACFGTANTWQQSWARSDGEIQFKVDVRVNRVSVRWERVLSTDEVLTRAERMLGADRGALADAAGDRWGTIEASKRYLVELPYAFGTLGELSRYRAEDRGIVLTTEQRRVTEATLAVTGDEIRRDLRRRWGKPRVMTDDTWIWRRADRTVTAVFDGFARATIAIR